MEPKFRKKHVLFVCIGNICRSPMAEAMARKYGSDVIVASSAGLSPALNSHSITRSVLLEKNVDLGDHLPRRFRDARLEYIDLIVNMSGERLPGSVQTRVEDWDVLDPIGRSEETFREVRDKIEMLVMHLILRIRTGKFDSQTESSRQ